MSSANDGQSPLRSASSASTFSKSQSHSVRSATLRPHPSAIRTVVTAPPWARDEPPSPSDDAPPALDGATHLQSPNDDRPSANRPSDVTSYQSSIFDENTAGPSRWWAFTRHRPGDSASRPLTSHAARFGRDPTRTLSIPWLPPSITRRGADADPAGNGRPRDGEEADLGTDFRVSSEPLHLDLPPIEQSPMTLAQTRTPGWETPWSPRAAGGQWQPEIEESDEHDDEREKLSKWQRRKKRIRVYMLTNTYVPLLFRFVNITFTTSALAIGIRIRLTEKQHNVMGALGASATLVIIFAPLTLVHVIIAIYLEYFGRPLGLWRTSGKLAHTLIEVVFICAWSAALALSFDNFFTSLIPCASSASTQWYSDIPRPDDLLSGVNGTTGVGAMLCNEQVALICLVGVGLIMYCFNLVISLYRIFEKVKCHPITHAHS